MIGSNGDIQFNGHDTFDRTVIEAGGSVSNHNGDSPPDYRQTSKITISPIDWQRLRRDAEINGKVYSPQNWTEEWQSDEYGNHYRRDDLVVPDTFWGSGYTYIRYLFLPCGEDVNGVYATSGDHQGRTYYFDAPDPAAVGADRVILYFLNDDRPDVFPDLGPFHRRFWNCTIAAPCEMSTYPYIIAVYGYGGHPIYFGDYGTYGNDGLVYLYCDDFGRDSNHSCWYLAYGGGPCVAAPEGAVIRTNGKFKMVSHLDAPLTTYHLKVVANTIEIAHPYASGQTIAFVGEFGPPDVFRLGLLD